jgi:hypothetical protein
VGGGRCYDRGKADWNLSIWLVKSIISESAIPISGGPLNYGNRRSQKFEQCAGDRAGFFVLQRAVGGGDHVVFHVGISDLPE